MSNNKLLLAATTATLLGLTIYLTTKKSSSSGPDIGEIDEEDDSDDELLSASELVDIFEDIYNALNEKLGQIGQMLAQVRASGQNIPDEQLLPYMKQEFESHLQKVEPAIYEKHNTNEEEVQLATSRHGDIPAVRKGIRQIRTLHAAVDPTGFAAQIIASESEVLIPKDLTPELVSEYLTVYMHGLNKLMSSLVQECQAKGLDVRNPSVSAELQTLFQKKATDYSEQLLQAECSISLEVFQAAMTKFQSEPLLGQTMNVLQVEQQTLFQSFGLVQ